MPTPDPVPPAPHRPLVIGLAGGIGSGKSLVASILADLGCHVTDSDRSAREVLQDPEVRGQLIGWWGRGILTPEGAVDRQAVARVVFGDSEQRRRLEALVHPEVERRRQAEWEQALRAGPVVAFVIDAPLLFEAGLDRQCDAVIFVDVPLEERVRRVGTDRGWEAGELERREKNQMPLDTKRERSDYVVVNCDSEARLRDRIEEIFHEILARHGQSTH